MMGPHIVVISQMQMSGQEHVDAALLELFQRLCATDHHIGVGFARGGDKGMMGDQHFEQSSRKFAGLLVDPLQLALTDPAAGPGEGSGRVYSKYEQLLVLIRWHQFSGDMLAVSAQWRKDATAEIP